MQIYCLPKIAHQSVYGESALFLESTPECAQQVYCRPCEQKRMHTARILLLSQKRAFLESTLECTQQVCCIPREYAGMYTASLLHSQRVHGNVYRKSIAFLQSTLELHGKSVAFLESTLECIQQILESTLECTRQVYCILRKYTGIYTTNPREYTVMYAASLLHSQRVH